MSPTIISMKLMTGLTNKKADLTAQKLNPDLKLGYTHIKIDSTPGSTFTNNGDDASSIMLQMSLPLNRERIFEKIRSDKQSAKASEISLKDMELDMITSLKNNFEDYKNLKHRLSSLERIIIPNQKQILELDIEDYKNGKMSYTDLLSSLRKLLNKRLTTVKIKSDIHKKVIRIQNIAGTIGEKYEIK